MTSRARGTSDATMRPATAELGGTIARFGLSTTSRGDLEGTGRRVVLPSGGPGSGSAGRVELEVVRGRSGDRVGGCALRQVGLMDRGHQTPAHHLRVASTNP